VKGAVPSLFVRGCEWPFYTPLSVSPHVLLRVLRRARNRSRSNKGFAVVDSNPARPPVFPPGFPKLLRKGLVGGIAGENDFVQRPMPRYV